VSLCRRLESEISGGSATVVLWHWHTATQ